MKEEQDGESLILLCLGPISFRKRGGRLNGILARPALVHRCRHRYHETKSSKNEHDNGSSLLVPMIPTCVRKRREKGAGWWSNPHIFVVYRQK
jgi:hypothetical protein